MAVTNNGCKTTGLIALGFVRACSGPWKFLETTDRFQSSAADLRHATHHPHRWNSRGIYALLSNFPLRAACIHQCTFVTCHVRESPNPNGIRTMSELVTNLSGANSYGETRDTIIVQNVSAFLWITCPLWLERDFQTENQVAWCQKWNLHVLSGLQDGAKVVSRLLNFEEARKLPLSDKWLSDNLY